MMLATAIKDLRMPLTLLLTYDVICTQTSLEGSRILLSLEVDR